MYSFLFLSSSWTPVLSEGIYNWLVNTSIFICSPILILKFPFQSSVLLEEKKRNLEALSLTHRLHLLKKVHTESQSHKFVTCTLEPCFHPAIFITSLPQVSVTFSATPQTLALQLFMAFGPRSLGFCLPLCVWTHGQSDHVCTLEANHWAVLTYPANILHPIIQQYFGLPLLELQQAATHSSHCLQTIYTLKGA